MGVVEEARRVALAVLDTTSTTVNDLWVSFWSMGGNADVLDLDAYVHGLAPFSASDKLAWRPPSRKSAPRTEAEIPDQKGPLIRLAPVNTRFYNAGCGH
ncbi:hypothetical protein [Paenarthrobacter aromaticivorans]|uniref:hypothetical protein n=1 Tax=Paenarthrobacter aromaticivorans TaxID=2849150 RepID=UPI003A80C4BB